MTDLNAEDWLNAVENLPAPKYTAEEVLSAIAINLDSVHLDEFWYDCDQKIIKINGITTEIVSCVEDFGGEGMGDERYVVIQIGNQLFRKDGYYSSYDGSSWDGDFYECFPVVRSVTFYERGVQK